MCWCLLKDHMQASDALPWARVWEGAHDGDLTGVIDELRACVANMASECIAFSERQLLEAFAESVTWAMYWQPPDDVDRALASPTVAAALLPIALAVAASPAARWWATPVARDRQQYVGWPGGENGLALTGPVLSGAAGNLAAWRAGTVADEERAGRERPPDPSAPYSGNWWSAPALSRLPVTTRALPGIGAVRLVLVEDSLGWTEAACWPVRPEPGARIYEVSGPGTWTDLVGRYPLDVTKSRRHDWWRTTGWDGRWLIPDFAAVAADYDAVHVTAAAYLTAATRALPVGDARTVLAGWDPDLTYWLTDVLTLAGPAVRWAGSPGEPTTWAVAPGA